jgi:hypothetical protein
VSVFEITGAVLSVVSVGGTAILLSSALSGSRQSEELLLITAATALLGWLGTRTLGEPTIHRWGFSTLFAVVTACAILHARKMWPSYVVVTVMTLVMCLAGILLALGVIG